MSSPFAFASPQFSSFLQFNILTLAGSVEAFINARITKRFARVVTRENTKFKTQKANNERIGNKKSSIRMQYCSAMV